MAECRRDGCDRTVYAREVCKNHYRQLLRLGLEPGDPARVPQDPQPLEWLTVRRIAAVDTTDHGWLDSRACANHDPDLFFRASEALDEHPWSGAVNACTHCPVAEACLAANLEVRHGYFARTTPKQRQRIRRLIAELAA